tara:strand:- start:17 stop:271 length:255 start_codon:yes stop_codon:yes gene_type:complete
MKSKEAKKVLGPCGYSELKSMMSLLSKKFEFKVFVLSDESNPLVSIKINNGHVILFNPTKGWSLNFKFYRNHIELYRHIISLAS